MFRPLILGLMLATATPALAANVPEPYRSEVVLYHCSDTITPFTAARIEANFYKINLGRRALIRASYLASAAGDPYRVKNYCDNLAKAAEKLR